jgi:glycosyltransferase involved in cell wall biosynthesis
MNICFLHNDRWPLTDGASIQSWQIISQLRRRHTVITTHRSPFPGVKKIYGSWKDTLRFFKKVDVLIIVIDGVFDFYNEKFALLAWVSQIILRKKIPVIWLVNAPIEESLTFSWYPKRKFWWDKLRRKFLAQFVNTAICVSAKIEDYLRQTYSIENHIIIPNGSDPYLFSPKQKKHLPLTHFENRFIIMWAGGGEFSWQGLDLIQKTANKMWKIDKQVLFLVLTNHSWTHISPSENLLIFPAVKYQELPQWLSYASCYLCLYHSNPTTGFYNSPMKLFDYMAMQKPIIATNLGQIKHIIKPQENGLLTNNNVSEIVSKILYLKRHRQIAAKLGKKARMDISRFYSWKNIGEQIENICMNVIS